MSYESNSRHRQTVKKNWQGYSNQIYFGYYRWKYNYRNWEKFAVFSTPTWRIGYWRIVLNRISKFHHDIRTFSQSHYGSTEKTWTRSWIDNKKDQIKSMKNDRHKKILELIRNEMSSEERKKNDLNSKLVHLLHSQLSPSKKEGF